MNFRRTPREQVRDHETILAHALLPLVAQKGLCGYNSQNDETSVFVRHNRSVFFQIPAHGSLIGGLVVDSDG
jgi:hypothetical protein